MGFYSCDFFDAYLKKDYDHDYFINKGFLAPKFNSYLNVGRICCHYSALSVYQKFVKSSAQSLLVFEDDLKESTYESLEHFNAKMSPIIKSIPKRLAILEF